MGFLQYSSIIKASDMLRNWTIFMACNDAAAKQTACIKSTAVIVIILYLPRALVLPAWLTVKFQISKSWS